MSYNITECQVYLTRKCNLRCGYCKLVEKQFDNELSVDEWKRAFLFLDRIGIKTVKLMGGEPTVLENLEELLSFINRHTDIKYAVLSNSVINDERLESLAKAGMQGYFASVDIIRGSGASDSEKKSNAGFNALKKLKKMGVKLLGANVVITSHNLDELIDTVTILSNEGFWVNLCSVIHSDVGEHRDWEYRKITDKTAALQKADIPKLNDIMIRLLQLKQEGLKLAVPDSYLINMSKYGVNCDWQCRRFLQLRIDADGAFMFCNDIRGNVAEKYNIKTMTAEKYQMFRDDWTLERDSIKCSGCYWSCFCLAEENLKRNRNEFYYLEEDYYGTQNF